ncbi:MAG TPA: bifunctional pyr operon transcriptional regulator/uracil phosphoribosyltransferase PyrR [Gammaproteobacteria bacterium]|nr:bifunctional pyr operon transcriptional regulator/uracil phosphoribosyltransferase PyrR [Gammaproteobacteria bacterium]
MNKTIDISALIDRMAGELRECVRIDEQTAMVGIHTGGVWIAQRLHPLLGIEAPLGELDISFYRDDFTRIGMNPQVRPSQLPFSVDDRHIILVDDVLHTGRTIRAAMNELFDYGRPASITLAVLVERDGRELPIEAAVTGQHMELGEQEHVKLTGPEPLQLEIKRAP